MCPVHKNNRGTPQCLPSPPPFTTTARHALLYFFTLRCIAVLFSTLLSALPFSSSSHISLCVHRESRTQHGLQGESWKTLNREENANRAGKEKEKGIEGGCGGEPRGGVLFSLLRVPISFVVALIYLSTFLFISIYLNTPPFKP